MGEHSGKKTVRKFDTGATRDLDDGKLSYRGFMHPLVEKRFAEYMHKNRHLKDGSLRDSDNWWQLFGDNHKEVCLESMLRHAKDVELHHAGYPEEAVEELEDSLCGIIFNAKAYLLKVILERKMQGKIRNH